MSWPANIARGALRGSAVLASCAVLAPANAQRTEDNAVVGAADAFGQAVGNEKIGLYGADDVRGFSPVEAGNSRLDGLYFVPVGDAPMSVVADSNTIRVGIAAQTYAFPAPTGIVDFALNQPDADGGGRLWLSRAQYGGTYLQGDAHLPIEGRTALLISAARKQQIRHQGGDFTYYSGSATLAFRPYEGAVIAPFFGFQSQADDDATPAYFPGGDYAPPKIPRLLTLSQPWAQRRFENRLYGAIAKLPFGAWRVEGGLFRATREYDVNYSDLFLSLRPDGTTPNRVIVVDPNNRDAITSGELRTSYEFTSGKLGHRLTASIRGRSTARRFGGGQRVSLGESSAWVQDFRPEPQLATLPDDRDQVRQVGAGVSYMVSQPGRFSLNAAVSRARYRKRVDFADVARPDVRIADEPWMGNLSASVFVTRRLAIYGGHVRGFEDPPVAPEIAVNRGDAPPALRTRQSEIGLRYALRPGLMVLGGLFEINKPYFNVDGARVFRQLGTLRNRGLELSLAGAAAPGVSLVAGTVLLDPRITGPAVESGLVGPRPVGSGRRRSILNLDWRLKRGTSPLSLDAALESLSTRVANTANSYSAPPRSTINIGMRYRFDIRQAHAVLRLQATNLFNEYGWQVMPSGAYEYIRSRTVVADLQMTI